MRLPLLLLALAHRAHSLPASSSLLLYDLEPAKIAESSAESSSPLVYDIEPAAVAPPLNAEREGLGGWLAEAAGPSPLHEEIGVIDVTGGLGGGVETPPRRRPEVVWPSTQAVAAAANASVAHALEAERESTEQEKPAEEGTKTGNDNADVTAVEIDNPTPGGRQRSEAVASAEEAGVENKINRTAEITFTGQTSSRGALVMQNLINECADFEGEKEGEKKEKIRSARLDFCETFSEPVVDPECVGAVLDQYRITEKRPVAPAPDAKPDASPDASDEDEGGGGGGSLERTADEGDTKKKIPIHPFFVGLDNHEITGNGEEGDAAYPGIVDRLDAARCLKAEALTPAEKAAVEHMLL